MRLTQMFPTHDVVAGSRDDISPAWKRVLEMDNESARRAIIGMLGLPSDTRGARVIERGGEVALLVPKRKRDARNPRMWSLAIQLNDRYAMTFNNPSSELVPKIGGLPDVYVDLVSGIGVCQFTQSSGRMIWPARIPDVQQRIHPLLSVALQNSEALPFYDHITGDFDCFVGDRPIEIVSFYHERGDFEHLLTGAFWEWLERRLLESLHIDE
jgi:hypothetical protein